MNGAFLLSASIFIYFTYNILDQSLCYASQNGLQRDPNNNFRFAQFIDHSFHVLDVPRVEGVTVQTWKHCLLRCAKNEQCFSTNTGAFRLPNGNVSCELLPTDKYNASEKFKANHTFHHFSIVSPCKSFPCQHGGTCRALYETNDYSCNCTQNYTGRNCEAPKASSCKEVFEKYGLRENKAYLLLINDELVPVYCHMTTAGIGACGGGQWTLVMKIDGTKNTFNFNSPLWNNMNTSKLPGGSTGFDFEETKLPTYWNTPFTKICLGMKIDQQDKFIVINQAANSLYSLIADSQYRATSLGRNIWKSRLVGEEASLELYCNMEGLNVVCPQSSAKVRIGIVANDGNYCADCDSFIGFGGPTGYAVCGNDANPYASDNGDKDIRAMGYVLIE